MSLYDDLRYARVGSLGPRLCQRRDRSALSGERGRAGLIRLSASEHVLTLTLHHIIADGWSVIIDAVMKSFEVVR